MLSRQFGSMMKQQERRQEAEFPGTRTNWTNLIFAVSVLPKDHPVSGCPAELWGGGKNRLMVEAVALVPHMPGSGAVLGGLPSSRSVQ